MGVGRGTDFLGVTRADRTDPVGADNGTLHQVDAPVVLHQCVLLRPQFKHVPQNREAVFALVFDVMDGKHAPDAGIGRVGGVAGFQVDHRKCALPVVRMENIGIPVDLPQHLHDRFAKVRIPLSVVVLPVQRAALEVIFIVDKVAGHAPVHKAVHAAVLVSPRKRDGKNRLFLHLPAELLPDGIVKRNHQPDVHAVLCRFLERAGQGSQHIAQSPGGCEGHCLRTDKQNLLCRLFHSLFSFRNMDCPDQTEPFLPI